MSASIAIAAAAGLAALGLVRGRDKAITVTPL